MPGKCAWKPRLRRDAALDEARAPKVKTARATDRPERRRAGRKCAYNSTCNDVTYRPAIRGCTEGEGAREACARRRHVHASSHAQGYFFACAASGASAVPGAVSASGGRRSRFFCAVAPFCFVPRMPRFLSALMPVISLGEGGGCTSRTAPAEARGRHRSLGKAAPLLAASIRPQVPCWCPDACLAAAGSPTASRSPSLYIALQQTTFLTVP